MDMADIKMPRSTLKEVGRDAKRCWYAMTDNNIELRLRFSFADMMIAAAGTTLVVVMICAMKRACRDRKIRREAMRSAEEKTK